MFRIWAKIFKDNHMLKDTVVENNTAGMSRTKKVFAALDSICCEFDLSRPIWLDKNIADFKRSSRVRFTQDSFIDSVEFDYLELQVLDED